MVTGLSYIPAEVGLKNRCKGSLKIGPDLISVSNLECLFYDSPFYECPHLV